MVVMAMLSLVVLLAAIILPGGYPIPYTPHVQRCLLDAVPW